MKRLAGVYVLALMAVFAMAPPSHAQTSPADITALRDSVLRRFELLPVRDGVVLRPRSNARVRSIEITRGPVAIDGQPVTGAELRERLGEDADLVLRVSYLSDDERQQLLGTQVRGGRSEPAPRASEAPRPPDAPAAPAVAPPTLPDAPDAPDPPRRRLPRGDDDRVHIGGGVTVRAGEVVDGNVVAVGGGADVDGEVRGDVVAVGGSVRLGPNAVVSDNVVVVGGRLQRDPAARVEGQVQEIGLGFDWSGVRWPAPSMNSFWERRFGSTFQLIATMTHAAILCLLAALVILLGRGYAERAGTTATTEFGKAISIGVLSQLLFLPVLIITIVVLCITIIGIPLLLLIPFAILGLMIVGLVGFTGVAQRIGVAVAQRAGLAHDSYYATTLIGIVALMLPLLLTRLIGMIAGGMLFPVTFALWMIGWLVYYLAWTIGFGAVALQRFQRRPVVPAAPIIEAPIVG
jgi:hypothetical protein